MFSDYIVYVDESGDHGLASIDQSYPVFVLSFCVFRIEEYRRDVVPAFLDLKFRFFGHDIVILHSHEIRKAKGLFKILVNAPVRKQFLEALEAALVRAPMTIIASVIDKKELCLRDPAPENPYEIALGFCIEGLLDFLSERSQADRETTIVVECRGKVEDDALELAFLRMMQADKRLAALPVRLVFADKETNSTGLQIADLTAYPIGRHHLNPTQPGFRSRFRQIPAWPDGRRERFGFTDLSVAIPPKSERSRFSPRPDADRDCPIHLLKSCRFAAVSQAI